MEKIRGFEVAKGFEEKGINLPVRKTKYSAGYDVEAAEDTIIPSFKKGMKPTLIKTGIKAYMQDNEYLMLANRSSNPGKKGLILANSVGIVDKAKMINPESIEVGDVVIGLASSGVHSNGFSLVRKVFNVNEENCQNTHIFDFSKFFQNYLLKRKKQKDILCAMNLLVNKTQIEQQSFEPTKQVVKKCFSKYIVEDTPKTTLWVLEKVQKVVELYEQIYDTFDDKKLNNIIYKTYVANSPRDYLYANQFVFSKISDMYQNGKITAKDIDVIVETLIKTNLKKYKNNKKFALLNVKIFDNGISYVRLYKNKYNYIFVPFEKNKIEFAKLAIENNEYMMKFEESILVSEDIFFKSIPDFEETDYKLKINGKFANLNKI